MKKAELTKWEISSIIKQGINAIPVIFGSILLALFAQLAIPLPFTPVPVSLQTLAVSLLAISLGKRKAPLAVIAYLMQATVGLPVLAGGIANPLWMIGPKAGYLLGFVVSAYLVANLLEKCSSSSIWKTWLILSLNEVTVLFMGSLWLSFLVGMENAFYMGLLPFLPGALMKITLATSLLKPIRWIQEKV